MRLSISFWGSAGLLLLAGGCGADDLASASTQGNLQAQRNVGGETPIDCDRDDAAAPPTEPAGDSDAGPAAADAGDEDCATPPESEPPAAVDAGYEDCSSPPSDEFPDAGIPTPPDVPDARVPATPPPATVDCPQGGSVGAIAVSFGCNVIDVASCKDLSNVVIQLADGGVKKFDGLSGTHGSFSSAQTITGAWIKAGAKASGDGPGYGQRFDAPAGACD